MAVQNRLAQAEEVQGEDAGLTQFDTHCKLCCLVSWFCFQLDLTISLCHLMLFSDVCLPAVFMPTRTGHVYSPKAHSYFHPPGMNFFQVHHLMRFKGNTEILGIGDSLCFPSSSTCFHCYYRETICLLV